MRLEGTSESHVLKQGHSECLQGYRLYNFSGWSHCMVTLMVKKVFPDVQPEPPCASYCAHCP